MHPDFERSRWWAAADNYLAMAHFNFERSPNSDYVWYMLLGWAECLDNLNEVMEKLHDTPHQRNGGNEPGEGD